MDRDLLRSQVSMIAMPPEQCETINPRRAMQMTDGLMSNMIRTDVLAKAHSACLGP